MARPIGDELDQAAAGPSLRNPESLIDQVTDRLHNLEVRALGIAAHQVGLAGGLGQDRGQRSGMVFDEGQSRTFSPVPYTGNGCSAIALRVTSGISFSGK